MQAIPIIPGEAAGADRLLHPEPEGINLAKKHRVTG